MAGNPRAGSLVGDSADFLDKAGTASVAAIHDEVNARRRRRGLPEVSQPSIRRALNSNTADKGLGIFERVRRGVYSLAE